METKNYKSLFVGAIIAAAVLLLTSYLYYNVMKGLPVESSAWGYKILYALVFAFALSYLCWKTKRTTTSPLVTKLLIGLIVSILILAISRLLNFESNETIICCNGESCWILALQVMMATASIPGKTGEGGDDKP